MSGSFAAGDFELAFIDELSKLFDISDRSELRAVLSNVEMAWFLGGGSAEMDAAALDALAAPVPVSPARLPGRRLPGRRTPPKKLQAICAVVESIRTLHYPLAAILAGVDPDAPLDGNGEEFVRVSEKMDMIATLVAGLAEVANARAVEKLRRWQGRKRGGHHHLHRAIRALVAILADYWTGTLRRDFRHNHKAEAWNEDCTPS